jgi:hypothetical protein
MAQHGLQFFYPSLEDQQQAMSKMEYTLHDVRKALRKPGADVPVFSVSSLGEYCEVTDLIRKAWKDKVNERQEKYNLSGYVGEILPWFRGARQLPGMLTPKLAREWIKYRRKKGNKNLRDSYKHKSIYDLENYYFDRFTRFGRPFLEGARVLDEIEWNYIMRHHEIPSRLLDWTKGSLIALSYAVRHSLPSPREINSYDHRKRRKSKKEIEKSVVWMLEPRRLMEMTTQTLVDSKGIRNIASRDYEVRSMRRDFFKDPNKYNDQKQPDDEYHNYALWTDDYWKYPLPLIPSHISARVESHLSRFTLHSLHSFQPTNSHNDPIAKQFISEENQGIAGERADIYQEDTGLDDFAKSAYAEDHFWYLAKIDLSGSDLLTIARMLRMTGVGDMNFTQDLDGLARELQMRAHLGFQDDQDW